VAVRGQTDIPALENEIAMMSMSKHANIVEYIESFMWEKQARRSGGVGGPHGGSRGHGNVGGAGVGDGGGAALQEREGVWFAAAGRSMLSRQQGE
jgi:hypothetical protein